MAKQTKSIPVPDNWKKLKHHPLSTLVEFGAGIDMDALTNSMRTNGYDDEDSIILFDGKVFDGRHRHAGAIAADVTPTFREFIGKDPNRYIYKKILRQHLDTSQRAMIAAELVKHEAGRPKESVQICTDSLTRADAAEQLNVSEHSVKNASVVVTHGTQEQQDAVRNGTMTVNAAVQEIKSKPLQCPTCQRKGRRRDCKACEKLNRDKPALKRKKDDPAPASDADESIVTDGEGHTVPEECRESFVNLSRFKEMDEHCRGLQKLIDAAGREPGGEQLGRCLQPFQSGDKTMHKHKSLNELYRDLKGYRPHSVCPWCKGKRKPDCKGCSGNGWVTKVTWNGADDAVKARLG